MSRKSIESIPGATSFSAVRPYHWDYSYLRIFERNARHWLPDGCGQATHYLSEARIDHTTEGEESRRWLRDHAAPYVGMLTASLYEKQQQIVVKSTDRTAVSELLCRGYDMPLCPNEKLDDMQWLLSGNLPKDEGLDHQSALLLYANAGVEGQSQQQLLRVAFALELDSRGYVNMLPGRSIRVHGCADVTHVSGLQEALQADISMLTS